MIEIHPPRVRAWQLPEDGDTAKQAFLTYFTDPCETWFRAYSVTMPLLFEEIVTAHEAGVPLHLFVDRSQELGHAERALIEEVIRVGVEVTIGTSVAGQRYIAHEKGYTTAEGECWEGSVNFSESGWLQTNTAFQFKSLEWRDMTIASFNAAVAYAWTSEREWQLMKSQPAAAIAPEAT